MQAIWSTKQTLERQKQVWRVLTCRVGKIQEMGAPSHLSILTTWETRGEGQWRQQKTLTRGQRLPNPDPFHCPEPALHGTFTMSYSVKTQFLSPFFPQIPIWTFITLLWICCFGLSIFTSWRYKECDKSLSLQFSCCIKISCSSLGPVSLWPSSLLDPIIMK